MFTKILHRPAMALVLSIILLFLGVLGYFTLPVSQFPDIAPPTVEVAIAYPGASADVLVDSVLVPLEQSINGVQGSRYIVSDATSAGEATIRIYFEPGTDPDIAVVNVQNRVNIVMNRLPPLVQREGILVSQVVPSMLMYVNIYSTDPHHDQKFLFNFANANVLTELKRIKGMGRPRNLGNRSYAMRIWLNPEKMRNKAISTEDVMKMIAEQSVIGSPGRLGQATGQMSQSTEYVLTYKGRFNEAKEYAEIILKATPDGRILRLKEVCGETDPIEKQREGLQVFLGTAGVPPAPPLGIELGSEFFDIYSDVDGYPSASIMLKQSPGSNAPKVIEEVKKKLDEMKKESFPPGMDYKVSYDVSHFLDASIEKVVHTLIEAFILVSLVVYMFLGDVRSTLIPILAVPVSLIGTFFVLKLFGQSLNLITLFAMVLAIGVVVDNAIVVVEAVHEKMAAKHLSPYLATKEVLHEISGAIIAITLVMSAVFIPVTFIPGPVGAFYRSFGITMATSIILSGFIALTLTPVLCAMLLRPHHQAGQPKPRRSGVAVAFGIFGLVALVVLLNLLIVPLWGWWGMLLNILFLVQKPFDWLVVRVTNMFAGILNGIVTRRALTLLVVGGFSVGLIGINMKLPTGFIPGEDQGIIYGIIQTPPGTTLEITNSKSHELKEIAKELEDVEDVTSLAGYEVLTEGRGSNAGTCIINLKDWKDRKLTARQIIEELEEKCKEKMSSDVKVEFFEPPAVPGFGAAGGFSLRVLDKTNTTDYQRLGEVNKEFMAALGERPELKNLFTFYTSDYPQYELLIDNDKAMQKGVTIGKALNELNILIGSTYEQGFVRFNQFYKVYVQAIPGARRNPEDLLNQSVKNESGQPVFYSAFMTIKKKQGLNEITRYDLYPSATIQGAPAAGYSTGQAIKAIKEEAKKLPPGYTIGWEGLSYDEAKKGIVAEIPKSWGIPLEEIELPVAAGILVIVVIFVYLVLVAQYESFFIPFAVMLSLPVGLIGSFFFLQLLGLANDVYAQMGLVMLVGLLGKNAILIVEFAVQKRNEGLSLKQAAVEGGKLRFRPIQMTSFAFIAGLLPLVVATGAGAIGNRTIGATAAGGMIVGTIFGVLVIPGLYYLFAKLVDGRKFLADETNKPLSEVPEYPGAHNHGNGVHGHGAATQTPVHHDDVIPLSPHPPPAGTGPRPDGGHK